MPEPTPQDANSNTFSAKRPDWQIIGRGKHSLVFDCGDGWVWKQARSPDQFDAIHALKMIEAFIPDGEQVRVPEMRVMAKGYFQRLIRGTHAEEQTTMRLAWLINQRAAACGLYFRDLISENIIASADGFLWVIDALCASRR